MTTGVVCNNSYVVITTKLITVNVNFSDYFFSGYSNKDEHINDTATPNLVKICSVIGIEFNLLNPAKYTVTSVIICVVCNTKSCRNIQCHLCSVKYAVTTEDKHVVTPI